VRESEWRTDASNDLNSASLACLYSSISLLASERASFSLWRRSGEWLATLSRVGEYETDIDVLAARSWQLLSLLREEFVFRVNAELPMIFREPFLLFQCLPRPYHDCG
jgi:hypothetical protein